MKNFKLLAMFLVFAVVLSSAAWADDKPAQTPPAEPAAKAAKAGAEAKPAKNYIDVSQADLSGKREVWEGKDVLVTGPFLFTGSDFCYQIRKTKINTRDYLCFALGPMNLVRFYLKKDHAQVDELLKLKKGAMIKAYGSFDSTGNDYKYVIVDRFEVAPK